MNRSSNRKGSVISVVMLSTIVVGVIVASIVSLINTQRRINLRKELQLQANNVAEAAADYAFSYISNEIDKNSLEAASSIPSTGYKAFSLPTAAASYLTSNPAQPAGATGTSGNITFSTPEVRVLAPLPRVRYFMDPANPKMRTDPNVNQWVYETRIPIVVHIQASQSGQTVDAYLRKDISLREVPLFQYAIYYAGQLQLHRGYRPLGDIHANGALIVNAHDGDTAKYTGFLTTHSKMYRGSTIDQGGAGADGYAYTKVTPEGYLDMAGGVKPVATGDTRISLYTENSSGTDVYNTITKTFDSRLSNWKEEAMRVFKGHLRDTSHEVPEIKPYGSDGYRLDAASTASVNEFTNGPYSLIEPLLPSGHTARKSSGANRMKLAAQASLIVRMELRDPRATAASPFTLYDKSGAVLPRTGTLGGAAAYSAADLRKAKNITEAFVARAYKYQGGPPLGASATPTLLPVQLPTRAIGKANSSISAIESNLPYIEGYESVYNSGTSSYDINRGLHDARLGRGVDLLTIDIAELKRVMEADPGTLPGNDKTFRDDFKIMHPSDTSVTASNRDWNGIVYIEFPTSLDYSTSASTAPTDGIVSYPFSYGSPETRHPDRASESDSRPSRTDNIVPIAPELRRYYTGSTDSEIANRYYAIPALQVINSKKLPNPTGSTGFTIATNAPVYLVGSYNSDGNYKTGTKIEATGVNDWAVADTDEVSAAIFSDTLTTLSDEWQTDSHRKNSFFGYSGASNDKRKVAAGGDKRVEIGACVATGEYPIFEFFIHALENFQSDYNTGVNPIIFKGSMAAMFHSEIQHIKKAYSRDAAKDIQVYYAGHGAFAIPTVRYHKFLADGIFPPGTPMARVPAQAGFRLLRKGDADDAAVISSAGL
ncbi:MAG: hypothetical protein IAE82_09030 [Opitutaceae bacterium]|nr:hypothetical protein [Opitutaceae bacterium]